MVSKVTCWRGLIFEVSCAYSKISPLPSLGHMSTAEKKGGGAYFREDTVYMQCHVSGDLLQYSVQYIMLLLVCTVYM